MSRYQSSLERKAQEAQSVRDQWLARLRLAGYLARRGSTGELDSTCAAARQLFASAGDPLIFAYVNFAEAMRDYFERGFDAALDKLKRADALCIADVGKDELPMLVKGWLAHIARVRGDWASLEAHAVDALSVSHLRSSEGVARISIVIADCLQQIRNYQDADAWYAEARVQANECGDDLVIASVMYNRPSCRVFNLRIDESISGKEFQVRLTDIEAQSVSAFSGYIRDHSMGWALEWLRAQTNLLAGDFSEALRLLESEGLRRMDSDWPSASAVRAADLLLCRCRVSSVDATEITRAAECCISKIAAYADPGDSAIAYRSLVRALDGGNGELAMRVRRLLDEALLRYWVNLESQSDCVDRILMMIRGTDPKSLFVSALQKR